MKNPITGEEIPAKSVKVRAYAFQDKDTESEQKLYIGVASVERPSENEEYVSLKSKQVTTTESFESQEEAVLAALMLLVTSVGELMVEYWDVKEDKDLVLEF